MNKGSGIRCGGDDKWVQLELFEETDEEREAWKQAEAKAQSSFSTQVGGDHYKHLKIQPSEFIEANKLSFLEGCIVKRASRWRFKDGIRDLEKIKHEVDLLIDLRNRGLV